VYFNIQQYDWFINVLMSVALVYTCICFCLCWSGG